MNYNYTYSRTETIRYQLFNQPELWTSCTLSEPLLGLKASVVYGSKSIHFLMTMCRRETLSPLSSKRCTDVDQTDINSIFHLIEVFQRSEVTSCTSFLLHFPLPARSPGTCAAELHHINYTHNLQEHTHTHTSVRSHSFYIPLNHTLIAATCINIPAGGLTTG